MKKRHAWQHVNAKKTYFYLHTLFSQITTDLNNLVYIICIN